MSCTCSDHMFEHYVKHYRPPKGLPKLQRSKCVRTKHIHQYLDCSYIYQHVRFDCGFEHNHNTTFNTHITYDQDEFGDI